MKCPRCGNEWDTGKNLCPHCGLPEPLPISWETISHVSTLQSQQSSLAGSDPAAPSSPDAVTSSQHQPSIASHLPPDAVTPVSIPARPQAPVTPLPTIDQAVPAALHLPSSLRARKLITAPLSLGGARVPEPRMAYRSSLDALRPLASGVFLRGGRYRLRALQSHQQWAAGIYEGMWTAQDAQRSGSLVMICELVIPGQNIELVQSLLSASTIALASIGRYPAIPTLWDAFVDYGRHFFVFEPVGGESLLMHMRRTGRALPEQDVIECCLQVIEMLELLSQQTPPMVHGLIRPEHIFVSHDGTSYRLTNFSVVLAGGGTRFVAGMEHARLSPYVAPELARGIVDIRSDLYSLLATAYHAVTGSIPVALNGGIPQAQRLNPMVSSQFDAILAKGLRNSVGQRFQRPSELRKKLLSLKASSANASSHAPVERPAQEVSIPRPSSDVNSQVPARVQPVAFNDKNDDRDARLSLPPMSTKEPNDMRFILLWIVGVSLCMIVVVLLIRGFM